MNLNNNLWDIFNEVSAKVKRQLKRDITYGEVCSIIDELPDMIADKVINRK